MNNALAGTGQQFNDIVLGLGKALNSPDAAIGHLAGLLDALNDLVQSANRGWPMVKSTLTRLSTVLTQINDIVAPPIISILIDLVDILPPANDLTTMFGGPILNRLDAIPNLPQQLSAGVGSIREVLGMLPAILGAFQNAIDPNTGRASIEYKPPRVAIAEPAAPQVCAAINVIAPGQCAGAADGLVSVSLAQLVLGSVGAR